MKLQPRRWTAHLPQKGSDPRAWSRSSAVLVQWCICSCTEVWDSSLKTSMTRESLRIEAWGVWKLYSRCNAIPIIIPTREPTRETRVGACSVNGRPKTPTCATQRSPSSARLFASSFNNISYHILIEQLLLTAPPPPCVPWWCLLDIKSSVGWKTEAPRRAFFHHV